MSGRRHHLLVIDDEPLHRRGVVSLVRDLRPDFRVFSASDGDEGLEMVDRNRIDIVFTDIRMARMDGLEFMRRLGRRTSESKVIIVSAYSHFDYARQALQLGAFDYMLKPIGRDDMERILYKTEAALDEDQKRRDLDAQIQHRLQTTTLAYEQQWLNRWVRGELSSETPRVGESELHSDSLLQILSAEAIYVCLAQVAWPTESTVSGGASVAGSQKRGTRSTAVEERDYLLACVAESLSENVRASSFWLEGSQNVLVTAVAINGTGIAAVNASENAVADEPSQREQRHQIGALVAHAITSAGARCTVGVSSICANPLSAGPEALDKAMHAMDSAFYAGRGGVILHEKAACIVDRPVLTAQLIENKLDDAIVQLQRERVAGYLDELIAGLFQDGAYPSSRSLRDSVLFMLVNRTRALEPILRIEKVNNLIAEMEFHIPECTTLEELRKSAYHFLEELMNSVEQRRGSGKDLVMRACLAYLEEKFANDLTLDEVARRYYFSPTYFSTLFRSCTGHTFTDYLLRLRLEKARMLLVGDHERIATVAQKVGFRDAGYFARVFKREVGVSPEEYRKGGGL